jgi:hypothetical protein
MDEGYHFKEGDIVALKPEHSDVLTGKSIRHPLTEIIPLCITGPSDHDKHGKMDFNGYFAKSISTDDDFTGVIWPEDSLMYWRGVKDAVIMAHEKRIAKLYAIS